MKDPGESRWMPPSPHREAILEVIARGEAHIVERGHRMPPLLVFEDGGSMELPKVRLVETRRGLALTATKGPASAGQTRFYDVCGTVDEILGQVREAGPLDPAEMELLAEDIDYMLARMTRRYQQYLVFLETARRLADEVLALPRPDAPSAEARLAALRQVLHGEPGGTAPGIEEVEPVAEHVRALAQELEDYLARCKEAAIGIRRQYEAVRGGRAWTEEPEQPLTDTSHGAER